MLTTLVLLGIAAAESTLSGTVTLPSGRLANQAIVSFTGSTRPKGGGKAVVDQRDRTFLPHVSVVPVGTRVQFPNNDVVFHNVFTEFNSTKFDLGNYPKGTSRSQVFSRPGLAVILCSIHPEMCAYVMVVDTPFFAMTDRKGHYQVSGVPSGHYRVTVWHESGAKTSFDTDVAGSTPIDIALKK